MGWGEFEFITGLKKKGFYIETEPMFNYFVVVVVVVVDAVIINRLSNKLSDIINNLI